MDHLSIIAYIDPGVGSLLMQALVGGSAGLFVFGKYLWRTYMVAGAHRS